MVITIDVSGFGKSWTQTDTILLSVTPILGITLLTHYRILHSKET